MSKFMFNYKSNTIIALSLMLFVLAVYGTTMAPTVLFADGGEFQFVPWLPGIAHPTGYPLYVLLGWVFSHLVPFGEVAWRLNFFSVVAGALAVGIVYFIGFKLIKQLAPDEPLIAQRLGGAIMALIFAFCYTVWQQALIAEVYSLHSLFVALVLWACLNISVESLSKLPPPSILPKGEALNIPTGGEALKVPPLGGFRGAEQLSAQTPITFKEGWKLALLFGLSLTHHRTMVLMLPAILLYLWIGKRGKITMRDGLKLGGIVVLPQVLYLYLPLIAPYVPYSTIDLGLVQPLILYDNSLQGFINHVMGGVFSDQVQAAAIGIDRLLLSLGFLREQVGWGGGLLALVGLLSLNKHRPLQILTLVSFIGFFSFNLIYFIGDVYVLFIPCWLIISLWIGLGWFNLSVAISDKIVDQKRVKIMDNPTFINATRRMEARMNKILVIGLTGLGLILPLVLLVTRYEAVNQGYNTIARDAWQEILDYPLSEGAILLSNDRNELMPMWYYQLVEKERPDLVGLFPLITTDETVSNIGRLLDLALSTQRPVYLIKPMPGLEIKANLEALPSLSHAQLIKVTPHKNLKTIPINLSYGDNLSLKGYSLTQFSNTLTVTLTWQVGSISPSKNYTSYIHLVDKKGTGITQSDHQPGGVFYPSSLWHNNETLYDSHTLTLPPNFQTGEYQIVVGLYSQSTTGQIENLGQGQNIASFIIQ